MRALDADIDEGIGRDGGPWQDNPEVVAAQRDEASLLYIIQCQRRERTPDLGLQELLALGDDDGSDVPATLPNHGPVHLVRALRGGRAGPP